MRPSTRRVGLAREALTAGDPARAAELADLDVEPESVQERAELLRVRAQLALAGAGAGDVANRWLAAEARGVAESEPLLAGLILVDTAVIALYRNEPRIAQQLLDEADALVGEDASARRYLSIVTGAMHTFLGNMAAASDVLDAAIQPTTDAGSLMETAQAMQTVVVAFASLERYDVAESIAQRGVSAARRIGAVGLLPALLCVLANTAYFTGDLDTLVFAAGEAADLAAATSQPAMQLFASACLALAHAVRGHADEVARHAATVRRLVPTAGRDAFLNTVLQAEGLLALGAQDFDGAAETYAALGKNLGEHGRRTGVLQWSADQIESLWRVGRTDEAQAALSDLEAVIGSLDLGWSQAVAARCRGLLDTDGAWRTHFAAAVDRQPEFMSRFELGRTYLLWAERVLAEGDVEEAHARARQAKQCFEHVAAGQWGARADALAKAKAQLPEETAPPTNNAVVVVRAFGPLTVVRDNLEQVVGMDVTGRLLRLLVANGGRIGSEQAIEMLWPALAPETGTSRLRSLLSRARRAWGEVVVRDGGALRWADGVVVDAALFDAEAERAVRSGDVALARRAIERYRGDLLPMARYDDWATVPRERARRTYLRLLVMVADADAAAGDVDAAIHRIELAAETDPYDESHLLRAAEILLAAGRPGAARRWLDRAERVAAELGVPPPTQLEELRREVLRFG